MKKNLFILLAVILLCGVTVSCSKSKDTEDPAEETAETVIMFFPYSSLEEYIADNIRCMKQAIEKRGGLGNSRLVVYKATSAANGILYEITYKDGQCIDNSISDASATFSSNDQESNVVKLQSIFEKIKQTAPAKSYAMVIGCHGNSWLPAGYYLGDMDDDYYLSKSNKAFGTASKNNQIANQTLVEALNRSNIHLNYLLFDACYMASIEAAYDFRNICDYYLASQNEILSYGVPYDYLGDALLKHNYREVVEEYYKFYNTFTVNGREYHYGSFSLTKTDNLEAMAALVKQINTTALSDDETILKGVQYMDGINPHIFFDFKHYINSYCTDNTLTSKFNSMLSAAVPYERHTDEFYTAFSYYYNVPAKYSCGLNTSQPTQNDQAKELVYQTEWWKATH